MNEEKTIRLLIERFMAGKTSLEEEAQITQWFSTHPDVSADLKDYQQMFAYFDAGMPLESTTAVNNTESNPKEKLLHRHRKLWISLSIAASLALIVGLSLPLLQNGKKTTEKPTIAHIVPSSHTEATDSVVNNNEKEAHEETTQPTLLPNQKPKKETRRKRGYHKHLFSPAPPTTLIAETKETSVTPQAKEYPKEIENLADAKLMQTQEEEELILQKVLLYNLEKELAVDAYVTSLYEEEEDDNVY